jgi:flagellar hook-associated protein 1 FlgK
VRPLALAATGMTVVITDPQRIAAADALRGSASLGNLGSGALGAVSVTNTADPNLLTPATIQFTSATTYTIDGNGPFAWTPGSTIAANGWSTTLNGTPSAGDSFSIGPRGAGSGDNGNARALAALARANVVGGAQTFAQANGNLVGSIGASASAAQTSLAAESTLDTQLRAQRDSMSGVNLDEEAANLIKYQQAYEAAAQVMAIADSLFQTMLGAFRR